MGSSHTATRTYCPGGKLAESERHQNRRETATLGASTCPTWTSTMSLNSSLRGPESKLTPSRSVGVTPVQVTAGSTRQRQPDLTNRRLVIGYITDTRVSRHGDAVTAVVVKAPSHPPPPARGTTSRIYTPPSVEENNAVVSARKNGGTLQNSDPEIGYAAFKGSAKFGTSVFISPANCNFGENIEYFRR